jgi:3-phytase
MNLGQCVLHGVFRAALASFLLLGCGSTAKQVSPDSAGAVDAADQPAPGKVDGPNNPADVSPPRLDGMAAADLSPPRLDGSAAPDLAQPGDAAGSPGNGSTAEVTPTVTAKAAGAGDQDDMAFWLHPSDPAASLLISSDKASTKVFVYDSAGTVLQTITPPGQPGNIDLRYNDAIVTANPNYGSCLYRNAAGRYYVFVQMQITGMVRLQQLELADDGAGKIKGTLVRDWNVKSSTFGEACVVDDEAARLYYADEPGGIYEVGAEPAEPTPGAYLTRTGENGLVADVEGLAIYKTANGGGYIIASSQGSNNFKVYDRKPPHAFKGTFTVKGATHTDGIDVTSASLGAAFPAGCMVVHGGDAASANFMARWQEIAGPLGLIVDTSYDPRK